MKKDFLSLSKDVFKASLQKDGVEFSFTARSVGRDLVKCSGRIFGQTPHLCDRCGDEFCLKIDEDVEVLVSNGVAKPLNDELINLIEFFDGKVDFDEIFTSEFEAIRFDYFYCENCKN